MKKRVLILLGLALVAAVAATAGYALFLVPCSGFQVCRDTPQLSALEERELMPELRKIFNRNKSVPRELSFYAQSPKPLHLRVSQADATLNTSGPIYSGSLEYAQAWYDVYRKHHPGRGPVHLHVVWPAGSLTQTFPLSESSAAPRDLRNHAVSELGSLRLRRVA